MSLDVRWYRDVNSFTRHTPWLHGALSAYALWAGLVVLALLLVAAYLMARRGPDAPRRVGLTVTAGLGVVVALLVNQHLLSPAVARTRPCHALHGVQVLLSCANDYSFPSDHCVLAGAFTVGLFTLGRRWGAVAAVLSLLLAFTRVYTGVHYPSDAAGGLVFGLAVGGLVMVLLSRPVTAAATRLARSGVGVLVRPRRLREVPTAGRS